MVHKLTLTTLIFLGCSYYCCGQTPNDRLILGEEYAKKQLKTSLTDSTVQNVISFKTLIIKDKETAINVINPILFSVYGENIIKKQQPYEAYLVNNYWIILGTLPKGHLGGTFLIIVDATNSKIIRLTHGK